LKRSSWLIFLGGAGAVSSCGRGCEADCCFSSSFLLSYCCFLDKALQSLMHPAFASLVEQAPIS
jgi:hypothetical protein